MQSARKSSSAKRPANLSLNSDLLRQARELDINISQVLEHSLSAVVKQKQAERWLEQNRKAIAQYNADVEKNGVFSEGLRSF